jgi:hypothetical protein
MTHINGLYLLPLRGPYYSPPYRVYSLLVSFIYTFDKYNIAKYCLPSLELQYMLPTPIDTSHIHKILITNNDIYIELIDKNRATVGRVTNSMNKLKWKTLFEFPVIEPYCISIQSTTNKISLIHTSLTQSTQSSCILHLRSFLFSNPYKEPLIIESKRQFDFGIDLKCRVYILAGPYHIPSR